MWFLYRPDAANVWKDHEVQERYWRYRGILDGKNQARYLIAKRIPVSISLENPLEKLWEEHDKIAEEFDAYLKKVDHEEDALKNIEIPEASFLDLKENSTPLIESVLIRFIIEGAPPKVSGNSTVRLSPTNSFSG